jgi:protein-S-isoprenylcysteine O-methyltransferase Ste14
MPVDTLWLRKGLVIGSVLMYWAGVFIQVHRVRKHIGRSPNVRPRGWKERVLWLGWLLVVAGWFTQPFVIGKVNHPLFSLIPFLINPIGFLLGLLLMLGGYAGTRWCYAALGDAWRMGVSRREKAALITHGPYRYVRHPIYLFQIMMLVGAILLLPTPLSFILLFVHLLCVFAKAADEEIYLLHVHGVEYQAYLSSTGRLLPRMGVFLKRHF